MRQAGRSLDIQVASSHPAVPILSGTLRRSTRLFVTTPRYDSRTQPLPSSSLQEIGESERNYVAKVLSEAFAADRLTVDELDDRLASMYRATTKQELGQLLADPRDPVRSLSQPENSSRIAQEFAVPERGVGAAIMGGIQRGAGWVLPRHFKAVAIMGGIELDLRDARIAPGVSEIEVFTMMGGVEVLVPDGVRVEVVGMAVMGGFGVNASAASLDDPNAPLIRISGLAIMGGVEVKRKDRGRGNQKRYEQALRRAEKIAKKYP